MLSSLLAPFWFPFSSPLSLLPQILDALNQVVLQLQLTQQQLASSVSMTKSIPITSLATTIQSDLSQIQSTLNSILAVMPQSINRCEIFWAMGLDMMLSWITFLGHLDFICVRMCSICTAASTCKYLVPFAAIHRLKQQVLVWIANNMSQYEDQSLNMWNIAVKVRSRADPTSIAPPIWLMIPLTAVDTHINAVPIGPLATRSPAPCLP